MGDNRGECVDGPVVQSCAPPEQYRGCSSDADCPGTHSCQSAPRACYLDNGALGGELRADGSPSAPVNDVSTPLLASIFCVAPTSSSSVNAASGLPGPARLTLRGTAKALP